MGNFILLRYQARGKQNQVARSYPSLYNSISLYVRVYFYMLTYLRLFWIVSESYLLSGL